MLKRRTDLLAFLDSPIFAKIDSGQQLAEADEDNNILSTANLCEVASEAVTFEPELKWEWTGSSVLPHYNQVMSTPVVAPLEDTNGDGKISAEEAKGTPMERRFDMLDRNGDGELDTTELEQMRQRSRNRGGSGGDRGNGRGRTRSRSQKAGDDEKPRSARSLRRRGGSSEASASGGRSRSNEGGASAGGRPRSSEGAARKDRPRSRSRSRRRSDGGPHTASPN